MNKDNDKIVKIIDANNDGIITKDEVLDFVETVSNKRDFVVLICPRTKNQHTVSFDKLEHFKEIFGVDDTWEQR